MLVEVVVVVVCDTAVVDDAEVLAEDVAAGTAAGAELELSPSATNRAAPTTPMATAVPTDIPPAAPDEPCWEYPVIGDKPSIAVSNIIDNFFFIIYSLYESFCF